MLRVRRITWSRITAGAVNRRSFAAVALWGAWASTGCQPGATDGGTEQVTTSSAALLGGANIEFRPDDGNEVICSRESTTALGLAMSAGRTVANSADFATCVRAVFQREEMLVYGPYSFCGGDQFPFLTLAARAELALQLAHTNDTVGITCIDVDPSIGGRAIPGSGSEHIWMNQNYLEGAMETLRQEGLPGLGRFERFGDVAGTIWHEVFHTHGYHDCDPTQSATYLIEQCMKAIWESSLSCDQTQCRQGRQVAITNEFDVISDNYPFYPPDDPGFVPTCVCQGDQSPVTASGADLPPHPFLGPANAEQRFGEVLAAGDFNNDGFHDLAVAIPGKLPQGSAGSGGAVAIYHGSPWAMYPAGLFTPPPGLGASAGPFGFSLLATDLNSDNIDDLVVGQPGNAAGTTNGHVHVYLGSQQGLAFHQTITGGDGHFGHSLAVDHKGFTFLVVGAPFRTVNATARAGAVLVYQVGFGISPEFTQVATLTQANSGSPIVAQSRFGEALHSASTFFNENDALYVGAPGNNQVHVFLDFFLQQQDGTWPSFNVLTPLDPAGSGFGSAFSESQLDFSPTPELLIGGQTIAGQRRVGVYRHNNALGSRNYTEREVLAGAEAGFGAAMVGVDLDTENPNWADVLVGIPSHSAVRAFLATEPQAGEFFAPLRQGSDYVSESLADELGRAFARGDFDGDGALDVAIAAPGTSVNGIRAGAVGVFRGLPDQAFRPNLDQVWKVLDLDEGRNDFPMFRDVSRVPFEFDPGSLSDWAISTGELRPELGNRRQGSGSLRILGGGYQTLSGPFFRTTQFQSVGGAISFELFLEPGQPNPSWLGAVQVYATIPEANIYNQMLAHVELTPLGTGVWRNLDFPIPANVRQALLGDHDLGRLQITINTPAGGPGVLIDNLRMTGQLVARPPDHAGEGHLPAAAVFSFDAVDAWSRAQVPVSVVALSGRTALSIPAQGYTVLPSRVFSTGSIPNSGATLLVDVRIPGATPRRSWDGALQAFLSCPTANLYEQWIGQVELGPLPYDTFNSVSLPMPPPLVAALSASNLCSLKLVLNVPGGGAYHLDNLRFQ